MQRLLICIILFGVLLIMKLPLFRGNHVDASYGSLIMAVGIFLMGVTTRFSSAAELPAYAVDFFLITVWVLLIAAFIQAAFQGVFRQRYLTHPVQSFAVGTWVAGTSVLCLVLLKQFPVYKEVISLIALLNGGLWVFYLFLCLKCYKAIITSNYYENVHGVLFMSTVSTQSLVILYSRLFDSSIFYDFNKGLFYLGILFYIINFLFILKRYGFSKPWNLSEDWKNTNCIVHGAMSITGMAALMSQAVSDQMIFFMWLLAVGLFVIIEGIETWRLYVRVKKYPIQKAAGSYHVSQWARNFTFGTLYVFTLNIDFSKAMYGHHSLFLLIREAVASYGLAVLICLLIIEGMLFLKDTLPWRESRLLSRLQLRGKSPLE